MLKKSMGQLRVKGKKNRIYARFTYAGKQREEPLNFYCTGTLKTDCKCRDHKAARAMLAEIEYKIEAGIFNYKDFFPKSSALKGLGQSVIDKSITFGTYAAAWLEQQQLAYSTHKTYKSIIYTLLFPTFGNIPIKDILPFHIRGFISKLTNSPKYIKNIIGVLSSILTSAYEDNLIVSNSCSKVKKPKQEADKIDPFVMDEVDLIIKYIANKNPRMTLFFAIGFYTGMRTGEIIGLKWTDFDFKKYTIRVQRTITQGKVKNSTKTSDYRTIKIPPILDDYINNHKQYTFLKSEEWVFLTQYGSHFTHLSTICELYWKPTLKALGLRYRKMYQMRHSFVCNALNSGQTVPYVQETLGHTTPQMIYQRYGNCINTNRTNREGFEKGLKEVIEN